MKEPPAGDELRCLRARLRWTLAGGALLANAWVARWVYPDNPLAAELSAGLAAVVLALPLVVRAVTELWQGRRGLHELVAVAVLAALAQGDLRVAAMVGFLMRVGQLIESRSAVGARAAVEAVMRLAPETARRVTADGETEVPASELAPGDRVRVRAGENIPADGTVVAGVSTIDAASVTGESLPAEVKPGDGVYAGTTNLTGAIEVEVTRAGRDTTLGRVRALILEAERTRLPVQRMIDRYAGAYTPAVLMLAGLVWYFTRTPATVVALLVVAVPGAFVLAAPSAVVAALGSAARVGVLVKDVAQLETAARLTLVLFDKTGTLTTGALAVTRLQPLGDLTPAELVRLVASAERGSRHPAALAAQSLAAEHGVPTVEPTEFAETPGRGIVARVGDREVRAGTAEWMLECGVDPQRFEVPDGVIGEGVSLVYCLVDGRPAGWLGLSDHVREEAAAAVRGLSAIGIGRQMMITGDRAVVAERVAAEVGLDEVRARQLPWEKVDTVNELRAAGEVVAMVGDGVNDGAALASADLGIAIGAAGSDVALNSASVALLSADLRLVPFLCRLARQTRTVVNQNLALGVLFVLAGLTASGLRWITPVAAGVLYNLSILVVLLNSARLLRAGEELNAPEATDGA